MDENILKYTAEIEEALASDDYVFELWGFRDYQIHSKPKFDKSFPNCCDFHIAAHTDITKWFNNFPNCCEQYKRLGKSSLFDKTRYKFIPQKILGQIDLTLQYIFNKGSQRVYDLQNHLISGIFGFGIFSIGADLYIKHLKIYLNNFLCSTTNNNIAQAIEIIVIVENHLVSGLQEGSSMQSWLFEYFEDWYSLFPFVLSSLSKKVYLFDRIKQNSSKKDETILIRKLLIDDFYEEFSDSNPIRRKITDFIKSLDNLTWTMLQNYRSTSQYNKISAKELAKIKRDLILYNIDFDVYLKEKRSPMIERYESFNIETNYDKFIIKWIDEEKRLVSELALVADIEEDNNISANDAIPSEEKINEEKTTKEKIESYLNGIDKEKTWEYSFRREKDFSTFVKILVDYFEVAQYDDSHITLLPKGVIDCTKNSQVRMSRVLKRIYNDLIGNKQFRGNTKFFDCLRVLSHYNELTDSEIEKKLKYLNSPIK